MIKSLPRSTVDGEQLRLLHVHAHPDDESSKGAATTARYVAEGVRVVVATCTGGELGSILNPALDRPDIAANLTEVRRREMDRARQILGVEQVWLGFMDSGLPEGDPLPPLPEGCFALQDPEEAAAPLVALIRELRPHVVTTYDEFGGYPHPDHIMCHKVTMAAVRQAADPTLHPELGSAWEVPKVYFQHTLNFPRMVAQHEAMIARGLVSPYVDRLATWSDEGRAHHSRITTSIQCGDWFHVRDQALLAHATQVDPQGGWFQVPLDVQRSVWPTEEFELAVDNVGVQIPENDLFAGIAIALRNAA